MKVVMCLLTRVSVFQEIFRYIGYCFHELPSRFKKEVGVDIGAVWWSICYIARAGEEVQIRKSLPHPGYALTYHKSHHIFVVTSILETFVVLTGIITDIRKYLNLSILSKFNRRN